MIRRVKISLSNDLPLEFKDHYLPDGNPVICYKEEEFLEKLSAVITLLQRETFLLSLEIGLVVSKFSNVYNEPLKQSQKELLSKREKEVLRMMFDGLTNKEIAQKLFISYETVKSHRKHILVKTGSKNTAALTKNLKQSVIEELKK